MKRLFLLVLLSLSSQYVFAFELNTVKVSEDVYALVGETGPRTYENHALNSNAGFIITEKGVILIDSGASPSAADIIQQKISAVTDKPVKWVINTGSQDHRWLGNSYFVQKDAEVIALKVTTEEQKKHIEAHLQKLKPVLRENADAIKPMQASRVIDADNKILSLGNKQLELKFLGDGHFPGDAVVWLPDVKIVFSGDLVYVDRMLGIQSYSPVMSWQKAFNKMAELKPDVIVPGHGSVCDLSKAQKQTGDYLDFLLTGVSKALEDWKELDETVDVLYKTADQFRALLHFESWHKLNTNRTYLQLEAVQ